MDSQRPLRILHVIGGMNRGGVETWLMHVLRHIDRERYRMDFLVHTDQECVFDREIRALGSTIHQCPRHRRLRSYAQRLLRILRHGGPYDVVHSHVYHFSGFVLAVARRAGIKGRIAHSHTTSEANTSQLRSLRRRLYLWVTARLIRSCATVGLAASGAAATALFGPRWRSDGRWRIVPCGIDLRPFRETYDSASIRRELGLPEAFVLGHVGRFVPAKNHTFLLQIAAELASHAPHVHLVLVGDGPTRPAVEAAARDLGIANRVSFLRDRPDVPRILLAAVDAFVFPSRQEGLGLALVEAQAAGIPCFYADTIPPDMKVVHRLLHPLSLRLPAATWARHVLENMSWNRDPSAVHEVEASSFNLATNIQRLREAYAACLRA